MTDIAVKPLQEAPKTVSRSLFQLALMRFRRNKAAMAGCVVLLLIAMFSFLGPLFVPHAYDQVFPSYVSIPPSLQPRPDTSTLQEAVEGVASRARVKLDSFSVDGQTFTVTISADDPIEIGRASCRERVL